MGCLASLSRFISCLGEKGLPRYRLLKKYEHFSWTLEAQEDLNKLKALLSKAPILVPPSKREPLLLYVTATNQVVSAAIVVERQEEGMHSWSNDRSISSVKSCSKPRPDIDTSKKCSMSWSRLGGSCDTTLSLTL
jgi:hypothetical protein